MNKHDVEHCSFCGKNENEVSKLFAGRDGSLICDECVDQCYNMLLTEEEEEDGMILEGESFGKGKDSIQMHALELLKPEEIKEKLDEYVIGQERAKKISKFILDNWKC